MMNRIGGGALRFFCGFLFAILFLLSSTLVFAGDVYVRGYYRKDGTYVRPHIRSSPNQYKYDNYGPYRTRTN